MYQIQNHPIHLFGVHQFRELRIYKDRFFLVLGVGLQQRGTIITKKTAKIRSDETIITKMRAKLVKMLTHVETIGDTTNSWGYIGNQ